MPSWYGLWRDGEASRYPHVSTPIGDPTRERPLAASGSSDFELRFDAKQERDHSLFHPIRKTFTIRGVSMSTCGATAW
jgi:hypothetical protein